jgi:hypothetical protein
LRQKSCQPQKKITQNQQLANYIGLSSVDCIPTPAELAAQAPTAAQAWLVGAAGASQAAPDVGVGWMFG